MSQNRLFVCVAGYGGSRGVLEMANGGDEFERGTNFHEVKFFSRIFIRNFSPLLNIAFLIKL